MSESALTACQRGLLRAPESCLELECLHAWAGGRKLHVGLSMGNGGRQ